MNFGDLKHILDITIARDDLKSEYGNWIQQSLRSIQNDNNWLCMKTSSLVTLLAGGTQVSLPSDFKELTPGRSPIFMFAANATINSTSKWLPCDVKREEELFRQDAALLLPRRLQTLSHRGPDIYLNNNGDSASMNIIDTLGQDTQFRVTYYRYLPVLEKDSDSNYFTEHYEEMVKNKIKAVAFEEIVDPISTEYEQLYEVKKKKAQISDSRRALAGRVLRMGG